jgi:hypothetical protein
VLVIELPRGCYVPQFHRRSAPDPAPAATGRPETVGAAVRPVREPAASAEALTEALPQLIELCRTIGAFLGPAVPPFNGDGSESTAVEVVRLLDSMVAQLNSVRDLRSAVEVVLESAIRMHGADFGNVQLYDERTKSLTIYAQRGFKQPFLDHFASVSADEACACGVALRTGGAVIVEDVECDEGFAPHRAVAADAGFRAVQSTPLIAGTGRFAGVLSTHFARPHRPSRLAMLTTGLYGRLAADLLLRFAAAERKRAALLIRPRANLQRHHRTGT